MCQKNVLEFVSVPVQGDPRVAQFYEKELVDKELWPLGEDLRERFENTKQLLLKVQSHKDLLGGPESQLLRQKLALRGPYVTPLNVLQVMSCRHQASLKRSSVSVLGFAMYFYVLSKMYCNCKNKRISPA